MAKYELECSNGVRLGDSMNAEYSEATAKRFVEDAIFSYGKTSS